MVEKNKEENGKNQIKKLYHLRKKIEQLETQKETIIDYLESKDAIDATTKKMWVSDVREWYYNINSAWQFLRSALDGNTEKIGDSKAFLEGAKSRWTQAESELKTFQEEKAENLISETRKLFEKIYTTFSSEFQKIAPKFNQNVKPVVKISESEYHLPCSVCGQIAVRFRIGFGLFDKVESLIYRGITHETSLKKEYAKILFGFLENNNIREVHAFLKGHYTYEGLDAYCPECNKVYCWNHYNAWEVFDEGFYDCTYGRCPNGHKRMIDD